MDNRNYDGIKWYKTAKGYWYNHKYGYQHVYVWEQAHQATVDEGDVVHHINEDKEDNRQENLKLMTREEHTRLHASNISENTRGKMSARMKGKQLLLGHSFSDEYRVQMSKIKMAEGPRSSNSSGFKGVSYNKKNDKYQAKIFVSNRQIHLGYFATPEEAALAYDKAALEYFGEGCYLNF